MITKSFQNSDRQYMRHNGEKGIGEPLEKQQSFRELPIHCRKSEDELFCD